MKPMSSTEWIAHCLALEAPRHKSLVVTVCGDTIAPHGGGFWLGSMIELLAPLGVGDRLVRTSVFRLVQEGWLTASREGRRSRYFCFVSPFPDRVALGFEYGILLTNDAGLLEGDGTQVRYVTIRRAEDIREQELATLIAEAAMVAATFKRQ